MLHARTYGELVMWLDSGIVVLKPYIKQMFERLYHVGSWFSLDNEHTNKQWTHPTCIAIMHATATELSQCQLLAGITGYSVFCDKAVSLLKEAVTFCLQQDCVHGKHHHKYTDDCYGHRHDQSILSILVARYQLPTIKKQQFMDWRNIHDAINTNHVFLFVHHKQVNHVLGIRNRKLHSDLSVIQSDTLHASCQSLNHVTYRKFEFLFQEGSWRSSLITMPDYSLKNHVLISGHSDYSMNEHCFQKILDMYQTHGGSLKCMIAQNVCYEHDDRLIFLPLGLTNDCDDSPEHRIIGNVNPFYTCLSTVKIPKNSIYLNFSLSNTLRQQVWDTFSSLNWVTTSECQKTEEGHLQYLQDIYHHLFTLCPIGNGVDTHRLWESIYLGTIPIVQWHSNARDIADLPILFVDSFMDIKNPHVLMLEYLRISQCQSYNVQKASLDYWVSIITFISSLSNDTLPCDNSMYDDYFYLLTNCNKKVEYHVYIDLDENIELLMIVQSYLATQNLHRTELHVWVPQENKFLSLYAKYIHLHINEPFEIKTSRYVFIQIPVYFLRNLEPFFNESFQSGVLCYSCGDNNTTTNMKNLDTSFITTEYTSELRHIIFDKLRARNIGKTVVLTHLGLGDHYICNSIIRFYYEYVSPYIILPVKKNNVKNVIKLYSDISIRFLIVNSDADISPNVELYGTNSNRTELLDSLNATHYQMITCGLHKQSDIGPDFINVFYNDFGLNTELFHRFDFKYTINDEHVQQINQKCTSRPYLLVHDTDSCRINHSLIDNPHNYPILSLDRSHWNEDYSMFDFTDLINNAHQVHVIDSSFLWLIELAKLAQHKRYFHHYVKSHLNYTITNYLSSDWITISSDLNFNSDLNTSLKQFI
jgi:hypothetical protein